MSVAPLRREPWLEPSDLRRPLAEGLRVLRPGETGLFALALPPAGRAAEPAGALRLVRDDGFLWRAGGETWVGLGAAQRLLGRGERRFAELRAAATAAAASLRWHELSPGARSLAGGRARWFGGFAFAAGGAGAAPWTGFGDAELVLPRWLVGGDGESVAVVLALADADRAGGDEATIDRALAELDAIAAALRAPAGGENCAPAGAVTEPHGESSGESSGDEPGRRRRYRDSVERALVAIAAGRVRKLVPARRVDLALAGERDLDSLLRRLGLAGAPEHSALFAFVRGERSFLGATPERLVRLQGRLVETHALAGSERADRRAGGAGREDAARRLLGRPKDRREHEWVVRHLVERLGPLCARLDTAAEPRVLELRQVCHLETEVCGELREIRHVLELVERLHPTPAVAGYPVAGALRWLAEHEEAPRGWYAGPVGWFDEAGDGDFRVALRAMLMTPSRAHLYAGAGVVEGSDPECELRETDLKLETARSALQEPLDLEPADWDAEARVPQPV
jgi:isochorismate synthase